MPADSNAPQNDGPGLHPTDANSQRSTVRGVVRNSLTGEGVPRALVTIEGDAQTGVLTAGDGSFEFPGVPTGPQTFTVTKPGFQDRPFGGAAVESMQPGIDQGSIHSSGNHSVVVAAGMPELSFVLAPAAAIESSIQFANGEPAAGVSVQLVQRTIEDGHTVWQMAGQARTRASGGFRFGNLLPGEYALFTAPLLDSDAPHYTENDSGESTLPEGTRNAMGYAAIYYPDARDAGGITPLVLAAGQTQQVAFTLAPEPFHRVAIPIANSPSSLGSSSVNGSLMDAGGRSVEYRSHYDAAGNSVVAMLPDGNYQILIATSTQVVHHGVRPQFERNPLLGMTEFTVAGKPLTTAPVALVPQQLPPIQVNQVNNVGAGAPARDDRSHGIEVLSSLTAGWMEDGVIATFASGPLSGPLAATYTVPGAYWLHPLFSGESLCEDSFAAAGASLAREPVHVAVGGSTPPLTLTLRHDCAQLTLHLPASVMSFVAGEEPFYTAWVVPDFDFTHDINQITLRPTSGDSVNVENLTPGRYRVYVFAGPHPLAFHDRAALAQLPSQELTLQPGGQAELTLEVPGR